MTWAALPALCGLLHAAAAPYVIAVGVNHAPGAAVTLEHADDDAAGAAELFDAPGRRWLLTVMDADTQDAFPSLASEARPPTLAELGRAVQQVRMRVDEDLRDGQRPTVLLWLVGPVAATPGQEPSFAMLDGALTPQLLEERVLAPLAAAHRVHLVVDAGNASGWVRAGTFPNVGFLLATSTGNRAFEWESMHSGVFSTLVRWALRGAADLDGDRRVTGAETAAFVGGALQGVPGPDTRPGVEFRPAPMDRNAPLGGEDMFPSAVVFEPPPSARAFHVDDARGHWLVAARFEAGFAPRLWLPRAPGGWVYRAQDGGPEAMLQPGVFAVPFGPPRVVAAAPAPRASPPPPAPRRLAPAGAPLASKNPPPASRASRKWGVALAAMPVGLLSGTSLVLGTVLLGVGLEGGYRFAVEDRERPAFLAASRVLGAGGVGALALLGACGLLAAGVAVAAWALWPR